MSGTTWTKFYWSDWETDPAVKLCSFAAQGLWMRLLCIAAAHDPIGYVAVAGRGLDETSIARVTGGLESEVRDLLGELDRNGVFSRDRQGRIYSRRMVKDAKNMAIAKKVGKEGGNPEIRRGSVPKANRVRPYRRSDNPAKTKRIFERGGGYCHWCKVELDWSEDGLKPNTFHVDHIKAVCDGGTNDESNLVSACASCNHARVRIGWENPSDTNPVRKADTKVHKPSSTAIKKGRKGERSPSLPDERERKADSPIPIDWPNPAAIVQAQARIDAAGVLVSAAPQALFFRNHALTQDRRVRDWAAAWVGWIDIEISKAPLAPLESVRVMSSWAGPADIRAAVAQKMDEAWVIGWLDRCAWRDLPDRAVVTSSPTTADRLRKEVGELLEGLGVAIVLEAVA